MQKRFEIGQIVNTFGIKGEVKVVPFTWYNKIWRFKKSICQKQKKWTTI